MPISLGQRLKPAPHTAGYESLYTTLDIAGELVKTLVSERQGDVARVLGLGQAVHGLPDLMASFPPDVGSLIPACERAIQQAEDISKAVPGQAVVGLGGEVVKGFATSVSVSRADPRARVTEAELTNALQLAERRALREARHLMSSELGVTDIEVGLLDSMVNRITVDGYSVQGPLNLQGRQLEVTVFNTFIPSTQLTAVQRVMNELDLDLVAAVSKPYALARSVADQQAYQRGAIFLHIGAGTTEVSLLRDGGLQGMRSLSIGGRAFTKRLATRLRLPWEQAEALKLQYSRRELRQEEGERLQPLLEGDAEVLVEGVALALQDLARDLELPPAIRLSGGGSALPEVRAGLEGFPWQRRLPFGQRPTITRIQPEDVRGVDDPNHFCSGHTDLRLMAVGASADGARAVGTPNPLTAALQRARKSLRS